jgi:hypothetical protein
LLCESYPIVLLNCRESWCDHTQELATSASIAIIEPNVGDALGDGMWREFEKEADFEQFGRIYDEEA